MKTESRIEALERSMELLKTEVAASKHTISGNKVKILMTNGMSVSEGYESTQKRIDKNDRITARLEIMHWIQWAAICAMVWEVYFG